jgi:hypothetical protein
MAWMEILKVIMQIIAFIMGIFNPPAPTGAIRTQYSCGVARWTQAPKMVSGELVGTVQQTCRVEGRSGGGLAELKQHLMYQVERDAKAVYAGPVHTVSNGESATQYSVSFQSDVDNADVETHGNSTLTASANRLRHTFKQTAVYSSTDSKYVTAVQADMEVTPTSQPHWYNVTTSESIRIKKPWFISSSYFQSKIVTEIEKAMPQKVIEAVNEMGSHL